MNHQPFESWLLDNATLTMQQQRELDSHLRTCAHCAALEKTNKVLRGLKMALPAPGFVSRFQTRLAIEKTADRRRKFLGLILFTVGGLALLTWLAAPYLAGLLTSPASWIAVLVEAGVFLLTTLRASIEAGAVMFDVLGRILPPFAWMVLVSSMAGVSLLWSVSIWRFVRVPQGV